ncbi:MAG: sulfurtransferase TusA family protein [Candidatus Micrarchaeia archaeon]
MTDGNKKVVDSRGSTCPGPITDLAIAYRNSSVGDEIELWATDPGVKADVQAWAAKTGNIIESITDQGDKIVVLIKIVKR